MWSKGLGTNKLTSLTDVLSLMKKKLRFPIYFSTVAPGMYGSGVKSTKLGLSCGRTYIFIYRKFFINVYYLDFLSFFV